MSAVLRILDANANRAREAIRVMEEAARFVLDDGPLTGDLKALRHDLATALKPIGPLVSHRDTPGDVGTALTGEGESRRQSVAHVAQAAAKRLSEALRAIEEYAKTQSTDLESTDLEPSASQTGGAVAPRIETLRYRGYELERRLNRMLATAGPRQWRLCLLLSESLCVNHPWAAVLERALVGGVDCVQVREKQMQDRDLLGRVRQVVGLCRRHGISVIVNDRPDIAVLAGADGVHLGQTDLPPEAVRRWLDREQSHTPQGRSPIVGLSTHHLDQACRGVEEGVDYCGLGPMFPTRTVHDKTRIVGPAYVQQFQAKYPNHPHLAIGGITPQNVSQVLDAGARGIAVSSAICAAANPQKAAEQLRDAFDS